MMTTLEVDSSKCVGCGVCVDACPQHAINMRGKVAAIDQGVCTRCGHCAEICPTGAIIKTPVLIEAGGGGRMPYGLGIGHGRAGGWLSGRGGGFGGRGGGWGFSFRGSSSPWPYVGRGRGGLPRCAYYLDPAAPGYRRFPDPTYAGPWGATTMTKEQELDYLKEQAEMLKRDLEDIEARVGNLEKED